jgi:hypothetical protein
MLVEQQGRTTEFLTHSLGTGRFATLVERSLCKMVFVEADARQIRAGFFPLQYSTALLMAHISQ